MVLSNKKLKQKLRAALVVSAVKELTAANTKPSLGNDVGVQFKIPRLSKREKRRGNLSAQDSKPIETGDTKKGSKMVESDGLNSENVEKSEKKKKRKRKEGEEQERDGITAQSEQKPKKKQKSKKKEQRKKRKDMKDKKKRVGSGSEETSDKVDAEPVANNESEVTGIVATKVYVGGIPYYSTEDDIRSFFEGCGTITEVDCMTFPESGKFRGITMITFKTEAAAKRALALDGADMGGLFLKIKPYKASQGEKVPDFAPEIVHGYNRIYAGNLSWDITEDDLRNLLSDCNITSIRFGTDKTSGEFRGYAHVDFADDVSLALALKLDQQVVCDRPVKIRCAVPKKETENRKSKDPAIKKPENGSRSGNVKRKRQTCYKCGVPGHLSSSCPKIGD